jgi:regulator of CtrA degradation
MSLAQANKEKAKVKLSAGEHNDEHNIMLVPERLRILIQRSKALQKAVRRLDATMHAGAGRVSSNNPVERQLGLLRAAFEHE